VSHGSVQQSDEDEGGNEEVKIELYQGLQLEAELAVHAPARAYDEDEWEANLKKDRPGKAHDKNIPVRFRGCTFKRKSTVGGPEAHRMRD
jgi:hypothetical protein